MFQLGLECSLYIAIKQHKGARLRVFEKLGSQYGDTDAPIRWYETWVPRDLGLGAVLTRFQDPLGCATFFSASCDLLPSSS